MKRLDPTRLHAAPRGGPRVGALSARWTGSRFGGLPVPNF